MPTDTQVTQGCAILAGETDPQPDLTVQTPKRLRWSSVVRPAVLTGGLLWLCFFPVAQGWLVWFALVPLLSLVRAEAPARRIGVASFLGGLAFYVPVLQWLRVADDRMYFSWAILATYCACYFPLAVALIRVLDSRTRLPLLLSAPVVWTALEYLRSNLAGGFAWYLLGYSQHDVLAVIQIADLTGVFGISFLIVLVNALLFESLSRLPGFLRLLTLPEPPTWQGGRIQVAMGIFLIAGTLGYGFWRLSQTEFAEGPSIALIQSNIDQRLKLAASQVDGYTARRDMLNHNKSLTDHACAGARRPDLIVWPETSYPDDWVLIAADVPAEQVPARTRQEATETGDVIRLAGKRWKTNVLLGVTARIRGIDGKEPEYNSAVLLAPDNRQVSRYDKMHRVPFGEYVPLKDHLPWMKRFAPYDFDYGVEAGTEWTSFPLDRYRFATVICYEDTDPDLARHYVGPEMEQPVDFVLNISNDGWFNGTSEHAQHLAICRFRAIECRRAVARSVNMGVSAVIDGNGRILQPEAAAPFPAEGSSKKAQLWEVPSGANELPVKDWHTFVKVPGVLLANIPIDHRTSVYAWVGNWLPWTCLLLLIAGLGFAWFRPVKPESDAIH